MVGKGGGLGLAWVLEEPTVLEVVLHDDVSDGLEDELDVGRVGGAGEVGVNLFLSLLLVQLLKLEADEGRRSLVRVRP